MVVNPQNRIAVAAQACTATSRMPLDRGRKHPGYRDDKLPRLQMEAVHSYSSFYVTARRRFSV